MEVNEFFDSNEYKMNKILLSALGLWPYQGIHARIIRTAFTSFSLVSFIVIQVSKIVTTKGELFYIFEVLPSLITTITCALKVVLYVIHTNHIRRLAEILYQDWLLYKDTKEMEIIKDYARQTRNINVFYGATLYIAAVSFVSGPVVLPIFLDLLLPVNESRPQHHGFVSEYFIDQDKYFNSITAHTIFMAVISMTVIFSSDSLYLSYVQHACSMLMVVDYQLHFAVDKASTRSGKTPRAEELQTISKFGIAMRTHREAIEYIELIKEAYSTALGLQLCLDIVCMSTTLLKISLIYTETEVFRFMGFVCGQLFHMFFKFYPGQLIIDHSIMVRESAFQTIWYDKSVTIQKFLPLVIQRSAIPCVLTAGGIVIYSMENYAAAVQSSMSYFTVLATV